MSDIHNYVQEGVVSASFVPAWFSLASFDTDGDQEDRFDWAFGWARMAIGCGLK